MKPRTALLAFTSLLMIASFASAAQLSTPTDPASATLAAIFSAPPAPEGASAKLPSFQPSPVEKAIGCGSCSDAPCVGQPVGTVCYVQSGKTYTCQHAYIICAARDCECWNGPLP